MTTRDANGQLCGVEATMNSVATAGIALQTGEKICMKNQLFVLHKLSVVVVRRYSIPDNGRLGPSFSQQFAKRNRVELENDNMFFLGSSSKRKNQDRPSCALLFPSHLVSSFPCPRPQGSQLPATPPGPASPGVPISLSIETSQKHTTSAINQSHIHMHTGDTEGKSNMPDTLPPLPPPLRVMWQICR